MKIAIAGSYRSGKDYLAAKLVFQHNYTRLAFADMLKDLAAETYPQHASEVYAYEKTEFARSILGEVGLTINNETRCTTTLLVALQAAKLENVVITDLRFENELEYCKLNGYKIVFLGRPDGKYCLNEIFAHKDLSLPARPDVSATTLLSLLA
jgi:hypothetical protein